MAFSDNEMLRLLLGEKIPDGGDESDTMFSDEDIQYLLDRHTDNLNLSALDGWLIKQAEFANYVDMEESGTRRLLSQLHKAATRQVEFYANLTKIDINSYTRPVAKALSLREEDPNLYAYADDALGIAPMQIRQFPLKRFKAILQ